MTKLLPNKFFTTHPINERSVGYITYLMRTDSELLDTQAKLKESLPHTTKEDREMEDSIKAITDPKDLLRWMRKETDQTNRDLIHDRLMANLPELEGEIKERLLTSRNDTFIEHVLDIFLAQDEDPCPWIREHYGEIRDPYARSQMCMALGFRGGEEDIDFLLSEMEALGKESVGESFGESPLVALYMICGKLARPEK